MTDPKPDHDQAAPKADAALSNSPTPSLAKGGGKTGESAAPAPRNGRALASFALLVSLGAAGGSGTLWYLWQQDQALQSSRLEQALKQAVTQPNPAMQELKSQIQQLLALKTGFDQLRSEGQSIREQALGLTGDLQPLKNTMDLYKGEIAIIKSEMKLLRESLEAQKTLIEKQGADFNAQLQNNQNRLTQQSEQIQNLKLSHNGLNDQLETLKNLVAKGGDINAFPLAEVDYLLRLADAKLKLERNLNTARLALDVAQQRLKAVNESAMAPVQTILGEVIASLRGVQLPDLSALSHKIVQMEGEVASLPLQLNSGTPNVKDRVKPAATATISTDENLSWWERTSQAVWSQFKDIVVIRRTRSEAPPLIAKEEEFFLRQNLQLEMESMRMALWRGDAQGYQDANEQIRKWTTAYFDTEDQRVTAFLSELQALQTVQFNPYIPDLAGVNQAFREALARRQPIRPLLPASATEQPSVPGGEAQP